MKWILPVARYAFTAASALLALVWFASTFWHLGYVLPRGQGLFFMGVLGGGMVFTYNTEPYGGPAYFYWGHLPILSMNTRYFGELGLIRTDSVWQLHLPLPFLLTLFLPLALGPFLRHQFPLWSYFIYTTLIAAELAFYLR